MAEIDSLIEKLPNQILEEIFSYFKNQKNLRLVSKRFCEIVDNSLKLMSKFILKVSNIEEQDFKSVNKISYKKLAFNNLGSKDVEFVKHLKHKGNIELIQFETSGAAFLHSYMVMKSILSYFDKPLDIILTVQLPLGTDKCLSTSYIKEFRNIKSLTIKNRQFTEFWKPFSKYLPLFGNSPNIKKLSLFTEDIEVFEHPANWQLEELSIDDFRMAREKTEEILRNFLKGQSSTLKTLKIYESTNLLNDITKLLPNLEILHIKLTEHDTLNEDKMLPNDRLKELFIMNSTINYQLLGKILKHYEGIEKLYLNCHNRHFEPIQTKAKHITVGGQSFETIKYLRSNSLKSLTVIDWLVAACDAPEIPSGTLDNIETLKVSIYDFDEICEFLEYFPALKHLYLLQLECFTEEMLFNILKSSENLESIGISARSWQLSSKPSDFLLKNGFPNVCIKFFDDFLIDMLDEIDKIMIPEYMNRINTSKKKLLLIC